MRLDSARELKLALIEQILALHSLSPSPRAAGSALTALNLVCDAARQASFALGIARKSPHSRDFRLAVRVQQRPLESSPIVDMLRKRARGEADIRYIGRVRPGSAASQWPKSRLRPLLIGASIGHPAVTAGTLGCFAKDRRGRIGLVSNNHVLAHENAAKRGEAIVQPGVIDGGRASRDVAARLDRFVRLRPGRINLADAAFAMIEPKVAVEPATLRGLGTLKAPTKALDVGDEVMKLGRTTGLTRGRISAIELDNVFVDYGIGRVRFDDQLEIEGISGRSGRAAPPPFSLGGDSGALIVTAELAAAALLFSGSDHGGAGDHGLSYATPIAPVLKALRVKLHLG